MKKTLVVVILLFGVFFSYAQTGYKSPASDSVCKTLYDTTLKANVYTCVDQLPEYPGGLKALMNYVIRYGFVHSQEQVQGSFRFELLIDAEGNVIGQKMMWKEPYDYTKNDTELLKMLGKMPKWTHAKCNNRNVLFRYPISICCLYENNNTKQ